MITSMTLLTDEFFESFASSVRDTLEADTPPPACYTDEEFFRFEREALFYREWLCVGREEWLEKPGDYFTATHAGEPVIVAKGPDGELNAMSGRVPASRHARRAKAAATCGRSSAPTITGPTLSTASWSARRR